MSEINKDLDNGGDCPICGFDDKLKKIQDGYEYYECQECSQTWMSGRQQMQGDAKLIQKLQAELDKANERIAELDHKLMTIVSSAGIEKIEVYPQRGLIKAQAEGAK
jgi:ubiquinone biosynthesis protein UbiJ